MTTRRAVPEYWQSRISNIYNLNSQYFQRLELTGPYDIPVLPRSDLVPDRLFPWDERNKWREGDGAIHFYCFDNEFEGVWLRQSRSDSQVPPVIARAGACLTPDFSLFTDFPRATQIWNTFRARLLGAVWATHGIEVIPSVCWSDPGSYDFCFDGLPDGGTLAIATGHIAKDEREFFIMGFKEMLDRCNPDTVLVYGRGFKGELEELANVRRYDSRLSQIHEAKKQAKWQANESANAS